QTMSQDNFGGGFSGMVIALGVSPIWGWPSAAGATIHFEQFGYNPWPNMKNLWLLGPNYNKPITLTGHDVRTGTPLWFQLFPSIEQPIAAGDEGTYTTNAVLDPANPNRGGTDNSTGHWNIWGTGIIVLQAGCYELDATWAEGSWHTIYALGR